MKKISVVGVCFLVVLVISCDDVQRKPSRNYMPDMGRSRAYETYDDHSNLASKGISYNNMPVTGTVNRGEELPYHLKNDSAGYAMSTGVQSPLTGFSKSDSIETERLFLINCAICHGPKMDGNGPLYASGKYPAKPATLVGDPKIETLTEGTIFHVQTYGKNLMGSYASQLNRKQRWMIARYIKHKQAEGKGAAGNTAGTGGKDSTAAASGGAAK